MLMSDDSKRQIQPVSDPQAPARLRRELLIYALPHGGVDVVDLVQEVDAHFSPEDAPAIQGLYEGQAVAASPDLLQRLAALGFLESARADGLRQTHRAAHLRARLRPPTPARPDGPAPLTPEVVATIRALPPEIDPAWRDPERLRRLAEAHLAHPSPIHLPHLLTESAVERLLSDVASAPFARLTRPNVLSDELKLSGGEAVGVSALFRGGGALHRLFSFVLGRPLPTHLLARIWRMHPGDFIAIHNDAPRYVAAFVLGLSQGWSAADGGGLAFGTPTAQGFDVHTRWLPHAGDLLLFIPSALSWHAVEPVKQWARLTLAAHYVTPT
jgi:hypothetical protein